MRRDVIADLRQCLKIVLGYAANARELHWSRVWPQYLGALAITALCTAIAYPLSPNVGLVTIVMFYLLGTTVGALRLGRAPSAFAAVTNMLAFNYFFVPPVFSFHVDDVQYVFALGVMLIVALVIGNLMISIRRHRETADAGAQRTAVLYAVSRELAVATDAAAMAGAAVRHICAVFHSSAIVLIADECARLSPITPPDLDSTNTWQPLGERCEIHALRYDHNHIRCRARRGDFIGGGGRRAGTSARRPGRVVREIPAGSLGRQSCRRRTRACDLSCGCTPARR
jgi:hypothetical protein